MKLIFSRKGFDSAAGGCANPILPDGRLVSLPIPDPSSPVTYGELQQNGGPLLPLITDLTKGRITADMGAHLDPDLDPSALPRHPSWRPLFGQMGAAQGHLNNEGVGVGDLFLFFGWFRQTEMHQGRLRFIPKTPDLHLVFGWFQPARLWRLAEQRPVDDGPMARHPHMHGERGPNNTLYEAAPQLNLPGGNLKVPGAGLFPRLEKRLVLTQPGGGRGNWRLPAWLHPEGRQSCLSYHRDLKRWRRRGDHVALDSVKRGQEYVLNLDHYPEAFDWLSRFWK